MYKIPKNKPTITEPKICVYIYVCIILNSTEMYIINENITREKRWENAKGILRDL